MADKAGGIHRCPSGHGEYYGRDCPACEDGIPELRPMSLVLDELTWGWKVGVAVSVHGHLRITVEHHDAQGVRQEVRIIPDEGQREEGEPLLFHCTTDVVDAGFVP